MPQHLRPLIQFPTWDGKVVLAAVFIIGYYGLVFGMSSRALPKENIEIVRDAMLTLGPPIGVIVGALFRSTGAEERREALRSTELQAAITAPSATATPAELGDQVEQGARDGTKAGVKDALETPDKPAPFPRMDPGRFPDLEQMMRHGTTSSASSPAVLGDAASVPVMPEEE